MLNNRSVMASLTQQNKTVNSREFKASVVAALARRGWRMLDLVKAVGKGRTSVSQAINAGKYPRVRAAIAKTLRIKN